MICGGLAALSRLRIPAKQGGSVSVRIRSNGGAAPSVLSERLIYNNWGDFDLAGSSHKYICVVVHSAFHALLGFQSLNSVQM